MGITRRQALGVFAGAGAAAAATVTRAEASTPGSTPPADALGLLYDATRCIGCKACMVACAEANALVPDTSQAPGHLWQMPLDLNGHTKTIIKLYRGAGEESFFKAQCMHCLDPACANACMLGALHKGEHGIVSYDPDRCIGCRYCEIACPFNIPKFEWDSNAPKIVKCELCRDRLANGKQPACTQACPRQAVIFGQRADLLAEAHRRIDGEPGKYVPAVYGEHEGGGTQVLYLSHVAFDKVGLPSLDTTPVPVPQRALQTMLYRGFAAPLALYGALAAVMIRNRRKGHEGDADGEETR